MRVEVVKALPLDYDPFEEDCCGTHPTDKLVIHLDQDDLILEIQEYKSGIGPSYEIRAKALPNNGVHVEQAGKGVVHAFVDDGGELNFYMENRTAR